MPKVTYIIVFPRFPDQGTRDVLGWVDKGAEAERERREKGRNERSLPGEGCAEIPFKHPRLRQIKRVQKQKTRKVEMHTGSPNVSCFSNKSPMISKKSKLCCAQPGHSRRICTSGLCFESSRHLWGTGCGRGALRAAA